MLKGYNLAEWERVILSMPVQNSSMLWSSVDHRFGEHGRNKVLGTNMLSQEMTLACHHLVFSK